MNLFLQTVGKQCFDFQFFQSTVYYLEKVFQINSNFTFARDGSTWHGHTVDPLRDRGAKAIRLSDPQFLPMEFPQFGHCRGVTLGKVFQPAAKPPGYWRPTCSWRGVVNLPEANQLLKVIPEAVNTLKKNPQNEKKSKKTPPTKLCLSLAGRVRALWVREHLLWRT